MKSERWLQRCSQKGRWYAAGQALDTNRFGRCCVENRRQKFWIPPRWQKIGLFSGSGEESRTPRAISRPLDHGSTWYLRAVIYIHWHCPTRSGLAVGWFHVEIEGLLSRERFLISVLTIFYVKAQVRPRAAAWTNNIFYYNHRPLLGFCLPCLTLISCLIYYLPFMRVI